MSGTKEKVMKKKQPTKVMFKAHEISNIEGFFFNPFLLLNRTEVVTRGGKRVQAVTFLRNSPFYGSKFYEIGDESFDPSVKNKKQPKQMYTKEELLRMAVDQNIPVDPSLSVVELYKIVFGGEEQTESI